MSTVLGLIPGPHPECSLTHGTTLDDPVDIVFYIDDIFSGHGCFEDQLAFLTHHLFPWLAWSLLKLSFKKLVLFTDEVTTLGIDYYTGGTMKVKPDQIVRIVDFPVPKLVMDVQSFLGMI